jgi:hypothetical protein
MRNRNKLLARAILLFLLLQILPAKAVAGDQEFHLLVNRMSAYYQKRPMPFMGLLSFIGNRFTPHGVGHLQMAIFEDVPSLRTAPGEELESTLQGLVGPGYQTFVRAQNRRSGDLTLIYVRESGKKSFEMLIVSIESAEAVLMKMQLDPDAMRDWMDEPVEREKCSGHPIGSTAGK